MIGGLVGRPVANSTGPGRPIADADDITEAATGAADEHPAAVDDPRQDLLRADRDVEVDDLVGEHGGGEVGHGQAHVGGPDVDAEDEPRPRIEGEAGRWATATRRGLTGRTDQLAGHQGVDALGDGRPAEARRDGQLAARPRRAVAEQLEQCPGAAGSVGSPPSY